MSDYQTYEVFRNLIGLKTPQNCQTTFYYQYATDNQHSREQFYPSFSPQQAMGGDETRPLCVVAFASIWVSNK
jgi:hypothetical protein